MSKLGSGREFDLIRSFLADVRHTHPAVTHGPGDDCAIIPPFAISTDMSVEDVHFRRAWLQPEEIGFRAAAAALSDLAAVAAQPIAALVSFAFAANDAAEWAGAVMRGATKAIEQFDAVLAGGDVTQSRQGAVLDVTVLGEVRAPVLRSGARVGDDVWITGTLGGAAAALSAWRAGRQPSEAARARFAHPEPRIREALWLAQHDALHAMIDVSDGIAGDARHIAAASGHRLTIDAALLPLHPDATRAHALSGGEDYELCFTASAEAISDLRIEFEQVFDLPLRRVGFVAAGEGVVILNSPDAAGYDHFQETST